MTKKQHECKATKKVERLENGFRNFLFDIFTLFWADIIVLINFVMFFGVPYAVTKILFTVLTGLAIALSISVKIKIIHNIARSEKNVTKRNKK